jgi:hypothetical protein
MAPKKKARTEAKLAAGQGTLNAFGEHTVLVCLIAHVHGASFALCQLLSARCQIVLSRLQ